MVAGAVRLAARDGVGERGEQGGLKYMRARVTAVDDGEVSAMLRRLDRRAYGRHRGRIGGPPRALREYGGVAGAVRGILGQSEHREAWASGSARPRAGSRREGARGTAAEGRPASAVRRATSRHVGARPE
jgi:hypothetical protein